MRLFCYGECQKGFAFAVMTESDPHICRRPAQAPDCGAVCCENCRTQQKLRHSICSHKQERR